MNSEAGRFKVNIHWDAKVSPQHILYFDRFQFIPEGGPTGLLIVSFGQGNKTLLTCRILTGDLSVFKETFEVYITGLPGTDLPESDIDSGLADDLVLHSHESRLINTIAVSRLDLPLGGPLLPELQLGYFPLKQLVDGTQFSKNSNNKKEKEINLTAVPYAYLRTESSVHSAFLKRLLAFL